jgi:peptidoglycan/xylan/chitin deacetylase (PgdA/CDA1 family)
MLHSIAEPQCPGEQSYYLSPHRWRRLLQAMKSGGYRCADPIRLEDPATKWGDRELVLTFDDGYDDFYTEVFPLIESHGLKPLVFLPAGRIGDENRWDQAVGLRARRLLDAAQIRELRRHGVRFGSHTLTHPLLVRIDDAQLRRELVESKRRLEDLLGDEVNTLAYPYGATNQRVRTAVIEAGYKLAFTTLEGLNLWQDPFDMMRLEFNQVLPPLFYGWKLRRGHGPMSSLKNKLAPLYRMIPQAMKAKIEAARRQGQASLREEDGECGPSTTL